jgi:hypothetical protein
MASDKVRPSDVGLKFDRSVVMPTWLNLSSQAWQAIGLLGGLAFVASLIGHSLTRNAFVGAIITVILFVAIYIGWNYGEFPRGPLGDLKFPNKFEQPSR